MLARMRIVLGSRSLSRRPAHEGLKQTLAADTPLGPQPAPNPPEVRFMQRVPADGLDHELLDGTYLVLTRAIPHFGEIE